jgi:CheY-specific phosphatase CheX
VNQFHLQLTTRREVRKLLDTSYWPELRLNVLKEIHLDTKNVRLEDASAKVEADIIEDLFVNEDALGLVEGICKVGYLTHEIPVAIKRRGKYVMVEGNRRLAALKAIQNPMLVPDFQARINSYVALLPNRSALESIRVLVAPNQSEADQLIAAIHTGNLRRAWSPGRQAAFFQAQIDSGRKLKELIIRYPTIDVRRFVFRANIINLFKSVNYDDEVVRDFLGSKQFTKGLSTLARIYESKEFVKITGLSMDADGNMSKSITDDEFKEVASAILLGMCEGNINTRSLNSIAGPRYTQLLTELSRIVGKSVIGTHPGEVAGDNPSSDSPESVILDPPQDTELGNGIGGSNDSGAKSPSPTKLQLNSRNVRKRKQKFLDLSQVRAPDNYPLAMKLLLGELSELDVQKYPNTTFLVMRAALEKSIKSFAEAKKLDVKKSGNNDRGRVQLGHCLNWLLDYVKNNGPAYLVQPIEGVRSGRLAEYTSTKDSLDAINHNHHFQVDPDQAISMWASIDSVMRFLMVP